MKLLFVVLLIFWSNIFLTSASELAISKNSVGGEELKWNGVGLKDSYNGLTSVLQKLPKEQFNTPVTITADSGVSIRWVLDAIDALESFGFKTITVTATSKVPPNAMTQKTKRFTLEVKPSQPGTTTNGGDSGKTR